MLLLSVFLRLRLLNDESDPVGVALTWTCYGAVRLAGAPPVGGFPSGELAATPLRVTGIGSRGGEDARAIGREIEHMSYLLSPK